ncbi:MAG: 30S ribosomal protein S5 [Candidatus ainarchaeum sp.]|jgi:small subunit ribosomal protein S5|nr:30S ribosomal protein S5 [Candidatus ainarchaeum sp.]
MSEEKKVETENKESVSEKNSINKPNSNFKKKKDFAGRKKFGERPKEEFEQRILDVARVTRVMKGGKRMSFRVCIVIGDKKGRVGIALGKGADVTLAVNKAVNKAKKNVITVPIVNDTIPHAVLNKFGSAKILIKPAAQGRGVIAGGVVRVILDLAGINNITSKILGTNNKVNNAKCTILALKSLRGLTVKNNEKKVEKIVKEDKNNISNII